MNECKKDIRFYHYLLFQLTTGINSFIETNYGDNFMHITNKLIKVAYRACRARGDGGVALAALVVTCCVDRAVTCCVALAVGLRLYSMRDTARIRLFFHTKMHGL